MSLPFSVSLIENGIQASQVLPHTHMRSLQPMRNRKSKAWNYFSQFEDENGVVLDKHTAVCSICKKECKVSGEIPKFFLFPVILILDSSYLGERWYFELADPPEEASLN